jgi:hypothetical protein
MPDFTFRLTHEQVDDIVLNELIEYWNMNAREIENLVDRKHELRPHEIEDLEDNLDLRTHLKAVIKYCAHETQRKAKGLTF